MITEPSKPKTTAGRPASCLTPFFLTVFLGLSVNLFGATYYRLAPNERIVSIVDRPVQTVAPDSTVLRPLRPADGVVLPDQAPIQLVSDTVVVEEPAVSPPFKPISPIADWSTAQSLPEPPASTVVHKPAIPPSAPMPDEEPEERVSPPPMPQYSGFAQEPSGIVRGQAPGSSDVFNERPLPPQGLIADPGAIPDRLTAPAESTLKPQENDPVARESTAKPLTNGVLLIVTVGALGLLVYFILIAFDYRQRWMELMTAQNNRLAPAFDDATLGFSYRDDRELYDFN